MLKFAVSTLVILLGFSVYPGSALQCWECSSDIDRTCSDRFNLTDYRYGFNPYGSAAYNQQQFFDPYNQRPAPPYDNRDYSTYRPTESYRDPNRDPNNGYRDPNYRGNNRDDYNDRRRDPYYRNDDDRDTRHRDYNNNNRTYDRDRDYDRRGGYDRYNGTLDYRNNNTNASGVYYDNRDRNYQQHSPSNRDYNYQNRGDYNNRDPNRNPPDRDFNNRDFNRDNRDYQNRDYAGRDPNYRDPYPDRSRDPHNNRDYNRDYNNRDGNRDPYFDRDQRDRYDRDPNNRDYPPPRDYNRDYNQGRPIDPNVPLNYPQRDVNYQRAQAQIAATQSGPRLITCNEEDARLRRMRNVCMKKVQRIGDYQLTYIRRCAMIPFEKEIGTCQDAVARGISLDFCEYCEYDGCNSATGLKFNIFLAGLVPLALLWAFSS